MPSKKIKTPLESGFTYHIYNRGNNYQKVFFKKDDYILFLYKFKYYLLDYCSIYAYALLPNHYHFLIRINEDIEQNTFSKQFSKFILSYTNKINWINQRNGSLFLNYFRRIKIENEEYLRRLVYYIHNNPFKHKIIDDFRLYEFSSYRIFLSSKPTDLSRNEVIAWFGSLSEFIEYHTFLHSEAQITKLTFEDI